MLALRGERYRVVGERGGPAGMWRLEGGKSGLPANSSRSVATQSGVGVWFAKGLAVSCHSCHWHFKRPGVSR